jgi:hypothetical protein
MMARTQLRDEFIECSGGNVLIVTLIVFAPGNVVDPHPVQMKFARACRCCGVADGF